MIGIAINPVLFKKKSEKLHSILANHMHRQSLQDTVMLTLRWLFYNIKKIDCQNDEFISKLEIIMTKNKKNTVKALRGNLIWGLKRLPESSDSELFVCFNQHKFVFR